MNPLLLMAAGLGLFASGLNKLMSDNKKVGTKLDSDAKTVPESKLEPELKPNSTNSNPDISEPNQIDEGQPNEQESDNNGDSN